MKSKFLLYDIETSPLITYAWDIWEANAIKVIQDTQILTVSWKWLGEDKVYVKGQDDLKGYKPGVNNDKELVKFIRELFNEADVVIGHNSDQFDNKKVQSRMMVHDLKPPSPYRQIDTKKVAKRYASFTSNKLDDLGKSMSLGQKLDTGGFKIWEGCMAGEKASWRKMKKYNKQDVVLLEQLYLHMRPWINNHPPLNLLEGKPECCPKCGKGPMHSRGTIAKVSSVYQRFQCQNCGGWSRARVANRLAEKVAYV